MELSALDRNRTIAGAVAAIALVASLFFLAVVLALRHSGARRAGRLGLRRRGFLLHRLGNLRDPALALLLAALAPVILGCILVRGHRLSYPPGEMTMVAGFAAFVLIAYNGIMFKPEPVEGQVFGTTLGIGYWIALVAAAVIGVVGFLRSMASGGRKERKAPGTV